MLDLSDLSRGMIILFRMKQSDDERNMIKSHPFLLAAALILGLIGTATAQQPKQVSAHKKWQTYVYEGSSKVCFASSNPEKLAPEGRDYGEVFFFVSNRPAEQVAGEAQLQVGFDFKQNSQVKVTIDAQSFNMFTQERGAWVENAAEEGKLVEAMKAGRSMIVNGESSRGTKFEFLFSLSGVTAAINELPSICG